MCPLVAQQFLDCVALMGDFFELGRLRRWPSASIGKTKKLAILIVNWAPLWQEHSTSKQTQWKLPVLASTFLFEEMHTQKSECQVGVANNIIKYIETGDTNMGIVQAHPSTCVCNKKTHVIGALQKWVWDVWGNTENRPATTYMSSPQWIRLICLLVGNVIVYYFKYVSFFHVWVFGLLQASRGAVCANNRYVAFAFVFA